MKKFSRTEIEKKVNDILVDKLGVGYSGIKDDSRLKQDFDADSLDTIEIVIDLEHEFGISISDEEMDFILSSKVVDVYDFVERLLNNNHQKV